MAEIIRPTVAAMAARGPRRSTACCIAGLMLTDDGPKLIEYNVRFGDPECQVLMLRLKSDLLPALIAARDGALGHFDLRWHDEAGADRGDGGAAAIPAPRQGHGDPRPRGGGRARRRAGVPCRHRAHGRQLVADGGRVLNVTRHRATMAEAQARAYAAVDGSTGYGPPAGAGAGSRAPASSEASGSGAANFGLGGPGLAGRVAKGWLARTSPVPSWPARTGWRRTGWGGLGWGGPAAPSGSGFASSGRPGSGSIGRPVVSGRPPWEEDDLRAPPASAPAPPAPEPARPSARFLLPGRGLGSAARQATGLATPAPVAAPLVTRAPETAARLAASRGAAVRPPEVPSQGEKARAA